VPVLHRNERNCVGSLSAGAASVEASAIVSTSAVASPDVGDGVDTGDWSPCAAVGCSRKFEADWPPVTGGD